MKCPAGHEMPVLERFKLDHEETDTPRDTENLRFLESRGVELGAEGTLYYCAVCDFAEATFVYPGGEVRVNSDSRIP